MRASAITPAMGHDTAVVATIPVVMATFTTGGMAEITPTAMEVGIQALMEEPTTVADTVGDILAGMVEVIPAEMQADTIAVGIIEAIPMDMAMAIPVSVVVGTAEVVADVNPFHLQRDRLKLKTHRKLRSGGL